MADRYAVRNISLCSKDCLCLYVCPTGASDTENSIIDIEKCVGCGACANACPSKAISMVPKILPPQQRHHAETMAAMIQLFQSKSISELLANSQNGKISKALAKSNRIMAEDIIREAGYMLPQSANANVLLKALSQNSTAPTAEIKQLLAMLIVNE